MKNIISILSLSSLLALGLISCQNTEPSIQYITEEKINTIVSENNGKLLDLNDLKRPPYMTEKGNYCDPALYRLRASGKGHTYDPYLDTIWLFAIDTLPVGQPLYIRGRVITDDFMGNFYKTLVIQQIDKFNHQQALRISVDASSIGGMYPLGQELLIRVDGLAIGRYANQPQLCVPSYNNNIYANKAEEKVGWAPGRIPLSMFKKRVTLIGLPEAPRADTITISSFVNELNQVNNRLEDGKLICIKDAYYTGQYVEYGEPKDCTTNDPDNFDNGSSANVFAPNTGNMGYPQSRIISDGVAQTLVSSSEYARFSHTYLPGADKSGIVNCKNYKGNITGILSYFRDNNIAKFNKGEDNNAPSWDNWSIDIRSLDDIELYLNGDRSQGLWPRVEYKK